MFYLFKYDLSDPLVKDDFDFANSFAIIEFT